MAALGCRLTAAAPSRSWDDPPSGCQSAPHDANLGTRAVFGILCPVVSARFRINLRRCPRHTYLPAVRILFMASPVRCVKVCVVRIRHKALGSEAVLQGLRSNLVPGDQQNIHSINIQHKP